MQNLLENSLLNFIPLDFQLSNIITHSKLNNRMAIEQVLFSMAIGNVETLARVFNLITLI